MSMMYADHAPDSRQSRLRDYRGDGWTKQCEYSPRAGFARSKSFFWTAGDSMSIQCNLDKGGLCNVKSKAPLVVSNHQHMEVREMDACLRWHPLMTVSLSCLPSARATEKPNILVIMGDDVGRFNLCGYHQDIMSGKTANLDTLASERTHFTDYYAEASSTAGRANFIIGQVSLRTGMTTVGQAGPMSVFLTRSSYSLPRLNHSAA